MHPKLPDSWCKFLGRATVSACLDGLDRRIFLGASYPSQSNWFRAFEACPPERVSVVILGQDPYHGPDQAIGLAFATPCSVRTPPSLVNIVKEWSADLARPIPERPDISAWAEEGVLLLNRVLTVAPGSPGSHRGLGWERLTDLVLAKLGQSERHVVFCLWGREAASVKPFIDPRHTLIESAHPSPLSAYRGFFGSKPFSRANQALMAHGQSPLPWTVTGHLPDDLKGRIQQLF